MRLVIAGLFIAGFGVPARGQGREYRIVPPATRDTSVHEVGYIGFDIIMTHGRSGSYPVVSKVYPDSPGSKAGIRQGDELLSIDSLDLGVRSTRPWFRGPDIPAKMRIRRADQILELTIIPPKPVAAQKKP
jgi:C-terminal processing protease CtpA/Prc